jgi:G protein-coupled receptor GPR1
MLNIFGSFIRSLWYWVFSVVVISGTTVATSSRFCQAAGFFINFGNEVTGKIDPAHCALSLKPKLTLTLDLSILSISIHGALQIFKPPLSELDPDGLDEYRYWIYAATFAVPILLSGLAFMNPENAFTAQGAFCALPPRPIWYRLALSWIPRYIVCIAVIALAAAVYIHVGWQFSSFTKTSRKLSLSDRARKTSAQLPLSADNRERGSLTQYTRTPVPTPFDERPPSLGLSKFRMDLPNASRDVTIQIPSPLASPTATETRLADGKGRRQSVATTGTGHTTLASVASEKSSGGKRPSQPILPGESEFTRLSSSTFNSLPLHPLSPPERTASDAMADERANLKRQLRLIFIYPIVYVVMWIIPFTLALMQYSPRYAMRPPPALAVIATMCLTLMGAVDCVVFLWREKPWRATQSRRSSSIRLHRRAKGSAQESAMEKEAADEEGEAAATARSKSPNEQDDSLDPLPPTKPTRSSTRPKLLTSARSSDQQRMAKSRARERLDLERADRREKVRGGAESAGSTMTAKTGGSKEWWERRRDSMFLGLT